jgi:hypothetical protein
MPSAGNGKMIARMLSGLSIQTGDAALLAVKVVDPNNPDFSLG